jgi:hypothetical protein
MHIVYLIKVNREEFPNKYIGSKSNCSISNGKIYDSSGRHYIGSATDKTYKAIVECVSYTLQVLGEFKNYDDALRAEQNAHIRYDVVASPEFFNKSIATISNYSDPKFATYKHVVTGKIARLPRDHPKVKSGEWVGVSKGVKFTDEERKKRGRAGKLNPFYGKTHTPEVIEKIRKAMSISQKGKPKSNEHKQKLSEAARKRWLKNKRN